MAIERRDQKVGSARFQWSRGKRGLLTVLTSVLALVGAACGGTSSPPSAGTSPGATDSGAPHAYALGSLPEFPPESLPEPTAAELQARLDAAVEKGRFTGVTAAVIVADQGSWAGAAGSTEGVPLTPDSRLPTHSAGKNIVAAQVLRLAEEGTLGLDDLAADHLPAEMGFFDANGATVRQVLGMRSGIPDLNEYQGDGYYPAEQASTAVKVFRKLPEPRVRPGTRIHYASTNYVLLGTIIERASGRPLFEALRSDVLDHSGLEGFEYTVKDALAADGWGVETTSSSLARWGYELYGGFVLSDASLREMTDFKGKWYGLGVMDFSADYGTFAVGHDGTSSATTCCSAIRLVALPEEGMVIAVQANTESPARSWQDVVRTTQALRHAYRSSSS
jgi:D-alanyl-D-alanine carboxypeptidase